MQVFKVNGVVWRIDKICGWDDNPKQVEVEVDNSEDSIKNLLLNFFFIGKLVIKHRVTVYFEKGAKDWEDFDSLEEAESFLEELEDALGVQNTRIGV